MAYDFKKEQKELYRPGKRPAIIKVPPMNYLAVQGKGDYQIPGYFDFVVPPLEGMWWQPGVQGVDYQHKEKFNFISLIRMPDFVTTDVFDWAIKTATEKKQTDFSKVEFKTIDEGLCAQILHVGPYDDEPATVEKLHEFIANNGLKLDINDHRHHHEIYLSDPRRIKPANLKTVLRLPVKKQ